MKKALIVLAVLNILAGIFGFFYLLNHLFYALCALGGGILYSLPFFAIVSCMDEIETLNGSVSYLEAQLKLREPVPDPDYSRVFPSSASRTVWECPKCKTVNKKGTSACANCGAGYRL